MPSYYADAAGKRDFTRRMFDASARDYDRVDRVLAFGTGIGYRRQALVRAGLAPGMRMLDVAVGTGLVAKQALGIVGDRGSVVGVDPSAGMVAHSQVPGLALARGRAEALPFARHSFDFLSLGYALRHLSDLQVVFEEFRRVLKPGGRLLVLEFSKVAKPLEKAYDWYSFNVLPRIGQWVAGDADSYRYLAESIRMHPGQAELKAMMKSAGFGHVDVHNLAAGVVALHVGIKC